MNREHVVAKRPYQEHKLHNADESGFFFRQLLTKSLVQHGESAKSEKLKEIPEEQIVLLTAYPDAKDVLKSLEEFCVRTNSKNTELCYQMLANFQRESNDLAQQQIRSHVQKPITDFFKRTNKDCAK